MQPESVPTIQDNNGLNTEMAKYLQKNDKLALFLDYDGTLAPLTTHPDATVMESESEKSLRELATNKNIYMAIISGRSPQDAMNKVGISNITYAGNHGLEIYFPNGSKYVHEVSTELKDNFIKLVNDLELRVAKHGAWVENKTASLTFHYREVPEHFHGELIEQATIIIQNYGYVANQAHCAIEARPPVQWNKGEAALHILRGQFGNDWHTHTKVIFAGDDTTDEDAMKALKGKAITFRVSSSPDLKTYADFRLPSTKTISLLLNWIENTI